MKLQLWSPWLLISIFSYKRKKEFFYRWWKDELRCSSVCVQKQANCFQAALFQMCFKDLASEKKKPASRQANNNPKLSGNLGQKLKNPIVRPHSERKIFFMLINY